MSHYKPYPAYKDSGVEWIGKVPEHWDTVKIARLGPLTKANGGSKQDNVVSGIPCIRYGDLYTTHEYVIRESRSYIGADKLSDYTPIQYGDALFAASGETFEDIGRSAVNLLQEEACCGGDVIVLRPAIGLDPLFLGYTLDSMPSKAQKALMGKGYTVVHIYGDQLRDLVVTLPPTSEQESIGAALSRETARSDTLIAKKTEFIELLSKKRQAFITHAVTKGLNPKAKMKDSGVEWIGGVPEHWKVLPLRRVASSVGTGNTPSTVPPSEDICDGLAWYTPGDFDGGLILGKSQKLISTEIAISGEANTFPQGSVLIVSIGATLGKVGYLQKKASANQQINAVIPNPKINGYFLAYSLSVKTEEMCFLSNSATIGIMNQEKTKEISLAVPPMNEQLSISKYLDEQMSRIDHLLSKTQHSIDLLKKRRLAFITAAVTGKIDFRETT